MAITCLCCVRCCVKAVPQVSHHHQCRNDKLAALLGMRPLTRACPCCCPQVPVYGHLNCGGCSTMLMFPSGAQSVKCSLCHHVTPATQASSWPSSSGSAQQQQPSQRKPPTQTVVVENPSSLDDKGNPVSGGLGGGSGPGLGGQVHWWHVCTGAGAVYACVHVGGPVMVPACAPVVGSVHYVHPTTANGSASTASA